MLRERLGEMVWSVLMRVGREVVAENSEEPGRLKCEYSERDEVRYVKGLNLIC